MLIIEVSYNFLYVWNCMKLYGKKFFIYGNCMIKNFGQPGLTACSKHVDWSIISKTIDLSFHSFGNHGNNH